MQRLVFALINSLRALRRLVRAERAFQQELAGLALSLPAAWFVAMDWRGYVVLVGSIVLLIIVEVLNTGIEAACDALSVEFHPEIQFAKDCGSLAVLIGIFLVAVVWVLALAERIAGAPL